MDEALEEQASMERSPPPSTTNSFQSQHEPVNALQENPSSSTTGSTVSSLPADNVALISCISYGARESRSAYTEGELHIAALLNRCMKSAYSQWLRSAESKASSSRNKRDTYSTLRLSCQQAGIEQLNFAQYKSSYKALLDLHNIELLMNVDGGERGFDPTSISSSLQRVQFLERFMNAFMDRLCGNISSSISSECLPTFTAAIVNLPESY